MTLPPRQPKIYHITHLDSLSGIAQDGGLVCDREMRSRGGPVQAIGMSGIKRRRIEELEVHCHAGTKVGDYVPFYFCPRSVMLFVIHCANHPELTYRGGQDPILHLEADLYGVIRWAEAHGRRWAFSLCNAGAYYTEFGATVDALDRLDWPSIAANDFRASEVKERKQAEFLVHEQFPFDLVERIGVESAQMKARCKAAMSGAHRPAVEVHPDWYF